MLSVHHLWYGFGVRDGRRLTKTTDYKTSFRSGGGTGILREEVRMNASREVVRYNLSFLVPHRMGRDNGRLLGYDNAHGFHERHCLGTVTTVEFTDYLTTAERFYREVRELRRQI